MAKKLQKLVAAFLAMVMCVSLISTTAFAEEAAGPGFANQVGDYLAYDSEGKSGDYAKESFKSIEDGKVTLSKTIKQTGKDAFDITLQVTTTEDLEIIKKARDAAIVIVMDVSGSMQFDMSGGGYCTTCGKYKADAYSICSNNGVICDRSGWSNTWAKHPSLADLGVTEPEHGETRFTLMENAVSAFLEDFADQSGSNAKRMVSLVCYNDKVEKELGWVNVTEDEGMADAQAVVAPGELTALTGGDTNTSLGLQRANEYLDDAAIEGIENTYVLLLTDGAPYTAIRYNADGTYNPRVSGVGYDCDLTQVAADKLKADHEDAEVYTVCFGYQGKEWTATHSIVNGALTTTDKKFNIDELMAAMATDADHFFRGEDVDQFDLSLGSIVEETVASGAKLWTVTDPMGDYILYQGMKGEYAASFVDNTLTWDLLNEEPSGYNEETGVYTYTMSYSVVLDVEADDFEFDTLYPANKATSLEYALVEENAISDIKTDFFNVPTVFATENKDFTVTFEPGTASHICFLYIDKEAGEVVYDSKIDFNDNDTSAEIPAKDGYISAVFIKQAQSGMIWTAEEVDEDTLSAIIESVKENDKAYKGHNAVKFDEGAHDLVYKNGTKTVTYYFSATGVSFDDVEDIVGEETIVTPETPEIPEIEVPKTEVPGDISVANLTVLDSKFNTVEVGAEVDVNDELLDAIKAGQMNANKFGAFEDDADAANGVVKLTFDVVGKPIVKEEPIDLLIIADESGSMNMYGRADKKGTDTSYMPCLNENHVYKVTGLQYNLNVKAGLSTEGFTAEDETYINPHVAGLECIVIKQWDDTAEGAEAVIEMVEAAGIVVPEGMSGQDVFKTMSANWIPDRNHGYLDGDTYVEIPYVENNKSIEETGELFSYWSPAADNEYGCVDRMMLEKEAAAKLAADVLSANAENTVGYISFTYNSYPSLCSGGFYGVDQKDDLMAIINKTEGHDYTNYAHALWTAKHYIENRETTHPLYIVFISDGMPTRLDTKVSQIATNWNILTPPVDKVSDGDCLGYNEILYGETNYSQKTAAIYIADSLKAWYDDKYSFPMDLFTIGINTNDDANEMLTAIASDEAHFLYCEDPTELGTIINTASVMTYPSGTLTDVIGEDFDLIVDPEHPFTVADKAYETAEAADADEKIAIDFETETLSWTLDEVDEAGVRITFYVKLHDDEMVNETSETLMYQTNADTDETTGADLKYVDLNDNAEKTVLLPTPYVAVPGTEPETPPAVSFESGSASHICFLFVDAEGNVIYDSKIDLDDNDTSVEIPVREGCVSVVFIKQARSGLIWTSEEITDEAVRQAIVDSIIENDPAYKGHSDTIVSGEGEKVLTYNVGNGKKAKTQSVIYTFE